MSQSSSKSSGGIGFAGMLTILFIGLKLTHYIDWSWWWVLSPLWLEFAVTVGLMLVVLVGGGTLAGIALGAATIWDKIAHRRRRKLQRQTLREIPYEARSKRPDKYR